MRDSARTHPWQGYSKAQLLRVRLMDLGLTINGTWLESMTQRILSELRLRHVRLRPHFWLSDEWFCPKGIPGVAIPFFLAHPRLMRLERNEMLEVEGGTRMQCLKLLRHEVGHAVQHGYELHRRRRWQQLFGLSTRPYPDAYLPSARTRAYVKHLDDWYAQSHPVEDFAETFAVWLKPRSDWRRRYADWPAIEKLEYVDELMRELRDTPPRNTRRARPDALTTLTKTLGEYYNDKQTRYGVGVSDLYDRDLERLFVHPEEVENAESAASFIRRHRKQIRTHVARWTGEYQYTLDEVLKEMVGRCKELGLCVVGIEQELVLDFSIMLTVHATHHLFVDREWRVL